MVKNSKKISPRAQRLFDNFNLTEADWQKIYDFQHGLCGICKKRMKKPNCDHDHKSGLIRGLLCPRCNRALGRFADDIVLLRAAVAFLACPPAVEALGKQIFGLPGRVGTKLRRKLIRKLKEAQK